jgi:hypothetical protein
MTAVTLYDALAQANGAAAVPAAGPLKWLAEQLIAASLADLQRLREFEEHRLTRDWRDADLHRRLTRSIYELDRQWVAEAEQILDRVRPPTGADATSVAATTPRADELEDACWRIRARLQLTPDQIERATDQARRGQTIPAEELRNELRARLSLPAPAAVK